MLTEATNAPPSRFDNPFATCWTRVGALPWQDTLTTRIDNACEQLQSNAWRGQIVGPHGSGKSCLLNAIGERLRELDTPTHKQPIRLQIDRETPPTNGSPEAIYLIEGFERLKPRFQRKVLQRLSRSACGYVVTTHACVGSWRERLAVVADLKPSAALLGELFTQLTTCCPTRVTLDDAQESFLHHRGNLREVWFDLYAQHERYQQPLRTAQAVVSYS